MDWDFKEEDAIHMEMKNKCLLVDLENRLVVAMGRGKEWGGLGIWH